ncbi:MAG: hypothetical protein ACUVQI_09715, partial [Thermochromatium sp.]
SYTSFDFGSEEIVAGYQGGLGFERAVELGGLCVNVHAAAPGAEDQQRLSDSGWFQFDAL